MGENFDPFFMPPSAKKPSLLEAKSSVTGLAFRNRTSRLERFRCVTWHRAQTLRIDLAVRCESCADFVAAALAVDLELQMLWPWCTLTCGSGCTLIGDVVFC